jgi:hypothetical protein
MFKEKTAAGPGISTRFQNLLQRLPTAGELNLAMLIKAGSA